MIRNKTAIIWSVILLIICRCLYFPFPNNYTLHVRSMFMSFPITNEDGVVLLGIFGSIVFILAITLLVKGLTKYRIRAVIIVLFIYALSPNVLIPIYQEKLASGIHAISYNGQGRCQFESVSENLLSGECHFELYNHSNKDVSFELVFIDPILTVEEFHMESLMNLGGPYFISIEANRNKSFHLNELFDVSEVPNSILRGSSRAVHFKLIGEDKSRIF